MSEQLLTAIRQSSAEDRQFALAELAREFLRTHTGQGSIPIHDEHQRTVAYLTPEGVPIAVLPSTPEWIAEMRSRLQEPSAGLTAPELIAVLKKRAGATNARK